MGQGAGKSWGLPQEFKPTATASAPRAAASGGKQPDGAGAAADPNTIWQLTGSRVSEFAETYVEPGFSR